MLSEQEDKLKEEKLRAALVRIHRFMENQEYEPALRACEDALKRWEEDSGGWLHLKLFQLMVFLAQQNAAEQQNAANIERIFNQMRDHRKKCKAGVCASFMADYIAFFYEPDPLKAVDHLDTYLSSAAYSDDIIALFCRADSRINAIDFEDESNVYIDREILAAIADIRKAQCLLDAMGTEDLFLHKYARMRHDPDLKARACQMFKDMPKIMEFSTLTPTAVSGIDIEFAFNIDKTVCSGALTVWLARCLYSRFLFSDNYDETALISDLETVRGHLLDVTRGVAKKEEEDNQTLLFLTEKTILKEAQGFEKLIDIVLSVLRGKVSESEAESKMTEIIEEFFSVSDD